MWQFLPIDDFSGDLGLFSCGDTEDEKGLNGFLKEHARDFHASGDCAVYLMVNDLSPNDVAGYFSLSTSIIPFEELPEIWKDWVPFKMNIPSVLIGKFALCKLHQGKTSEEGIKISQILVTEVYRRILEQYNEKKIGFKAVRVDTQNTNPRAQEFWAKQGFIPFRKTGRFLFFPVDRLQKYFA